MAGITKERIAAEAAKLADREHTYEGVQFTFRRMSAWRGFEVLEELRTGLGSALALSLIHI